MDGACWVVVKVDKYLGEVLNSFCWQENLWHLFDEYGYRWVKVCYSGIIYIIISANKNDDGGG